MDRWRGRVALVTGASSGIGAEICRCLVKAGMKVLGVARRAEIVKDISEELKGEAGVLYSLKCDLSSSEEIESMFLSINKDYGGVDICINNAAFFIYESLLDGNPANWDKMMKVNVMAYAHCSKLSIASMKSKGVDDGHIIFISSVAAHKVFDYPCIHFYTATKFAIRALAEGFNLELKANKSNIRMTCVSPGAVATDIFESALMPKEDIESITKSGEILTPSDVSSSVVHILSCPPTVQIKDIIITTIQG